jgi:hypothetical protein
MYRGYQYDVRRMAPGYCRQPNVDSELTKPDSGMPKQKRAMTSPTVFCVALMQVVTMPEASA